MNNFFKKDVCGACYAISMITFFVMLLTSVLPDLAFAKFAYVPAYEINAFLTIIFVSCLFFYFNQPLKNIASDNNQLFVTSLFAVITLLCATSFISQFIILCDGARALDYMFSMLYNLIFAATFGVFAVQTMRNFPTPKIANLFSLILFAGLLFVIIDWLIAMVSNFTVAMLFEFLFTLIIYSGFFCGIFFELKSKFSE
jgi:hypothetical protein